jgi:hypothetical protein
MLSPLYWLSAALLSMTIAAQTQKTQAQPMPLPPETIVVFLDLSVQPGGLTVITGKSYGITNFIVTDRMGAVLMEKNVEVSGLGDRTVVVYRGADRETYSCTPMCSRRLTLGDHPEYFEKTLGEIVTLNNQATGAGAAQSGH